MNEQKPPKGIEWTRVYGRRGYTWNPVSGCKHDCQWVMPGGAIAECYAKTIAESRQVNVHYPHGFDHDYWHPERLIEPEKVKQGAGIFLDSMSDLMGAWVDEIHIRRILDVCERTPQHLYFLLTKNAPRLLKFEFPDNVWVGVSSPPDYMFGRGLSRMQQVAMLEKSLVALSRVKAKVRWMSYEPLSWDVAPIVGEYPGAIQWAVIGAASNGRQEYPPEESHLRNLLDVLDCHKVPTFFKGNLRSLPWAAENWREDFPGSSAVVPVQEPVEKPIQPTLF